MVGVSMDALIARFSGPALALARRIVVDHRLAEEVVQEVFLAAWRRPQGFDPRRGSLSAWLLAMVHHKAVDVVRHEQAARRRMPRDRLGSVVGRGELAADAADQACDRVADSRVRAALLTLPLAQRESLVLAYWGGYTQRQIAALTCTPLGTVKTRMRVGMQRLSRLLADLAAAPVVPRVPAEPGASVPARPTRHAPGALSAPLLDIVTVATETPGDVPAPAVAGTAQRVAV